MDSFKYIEVLNAIFEDTLTSLLRARIENEIKRQENEFTHSFELFYLLMVFKISLPDSCFEDYLETEQTGMQAPVMSPEWKQKITNDKVKILSSLPELRMKSL